MEPLHPKIHIFNQNVNGPGRFCIKKEKVFHEPFGYNRKQKCYINGETDDYKNIKIPIVTATWTHWHARVDLLGSSAQKEAHKRDQDTSGDIMTYIKDTFVRHVDSIFVPKCIYERILDGFVRVTVAGKENVKGAEGSDNKIDNGSSVARFRKKWNKSKNVVIVTFIRTRRSGKYCLVYKVRKIIPS